MHISYNNYDVIYMHAMVKLYIKNHLTVTNFDIFRGMMCNKARRSQARTIVYFVIKNVNRIFSFNGLYKVYSGGLKTFLETFLKRL